MPRHNFIDLAKGIAVISIVLAHAVSLVEETYYYPYLVIPQKIMFSFALPLFFMISAVFQRKKLEDINLSTIMILKKNTSALLKPFYTLSLLFFFINISAPKAMGMPGASDMIKALLYMQSDGNNMPSGVLWFLFVLFAFSLITIVCIKFIKVNIYTLFVFSVILNGSSVVFTQNSYLAINRITEFYVYYMAGYLFSEYILYERRMFLSSFSLLFFFICWITSFIFVKYYNIGNELGIVGILGSLFILSFCRKINDMFSSVVLVNYLRFCGEKSIVIYVFHAPTIMITKHMITQLNINDHFVGFIILVLSAVFSPIVYGWILSHNRTSYELLLGRYPGKYFA